MYRTDKQFMTNPSTAGSRVYIGGLAKTIVATDLEEKFKMHGKILGLVLQMGFAFIQYENENQAQAAINKETNSMLHGRKICVRQALDKSQRGPNNSNHPNNQVQNRRQGPPAPPPRQSPSAPPPRQGPSGPPPRQGPSAPPPRQGPPAPPPLLVHNNDNQAQTFEEPEDVGPKPEPEKDTQEQPPPLLNSGPKQPPPLLNVGPKQPPPLLNAGPKQPPPLLNAGPKQPPPLLNAGPKNLPLGDLRDNEGNAERRGRKRRARSRERFPGQGDSYRDEPYYGREDYQVNYPPNRPPAVDQPDRNDCEIIVVSKPLTKYAEYIEQRLKTLGLIVDLLFPNEDVPIGRVLANISSRGCLYAILVMPQNEEHRSLTLNILHGKPQEHRNMPIEDALVLITRNFDAYMRGDKSSCETLGPGGVLSVSDRHPTAMQLLLNLLAENRQITSTQYDRLLKYLQDRREVQQQHEVAEGVDEESQGSNSKQAELQSRIMNILNKTSNDNQPSPIETPQPEVAPPLLKDPSVQKALDSLLGGEMFKNISGAM